MKKLILLLTICTAIIAGAFAQVCTIDSTNFTSGKYVYPDSLPCISRDLSFSGTVNIKVPDSLDASTFSSSIPANTYYIHVDSIRIDSITGMPTGITAATNPVPGTWVHGGEYACALFAGTTTDTAGTYPINIYGKGCIHGTILIYNIDSCESGSLSSYLSYSLRVCNAAGINSIADNMLMNIYPNPNQGNFTVTVSSSDHVHGSLSVVDQLGRTVYSNSIDMTGTKQIPLNLAGLSPGAYILEINTAAGKSVKQFIIE
jgi:hypothetical protein